MWKRDEQQLLMCLPDNFFPYDISFLIFRPPICRYSLDGQKRSDDDDDDGGDKLPLLLMCDDKDEESEYDPRHETGAGHRIDRLGMSLRVASYVDDMADEDHAPYEDEQHRRHRRNECECSHGRGTH